jgi:hypothetical protein
MPHYNPPNQKRSGYDTAQVCLNGHVITRFAESDPEIKKKFCDKCGASTLLACPKCSNKIQGFHYGSMPDLSRTGPPAFCHECGTAYPWTEQRIAAANQLADENASFSNEEHAQFQTSLNDLVRNTPSAPLAVSRFKRLMAKSGYAFSNGVRDILVDVLSEAVKKSIWG